MIIVSSKTTTGVSTLLVFLSEKQLMVADILPILLNISNCLIPCLLLTSSILDVLMSFCTSVRSAAVLGP